MEETNYLIETEEVSVVQYVNKILLEAIQQDASDIHFEPYEKKYRIRYRIDGLLSEVAIAPMHFSSQITARIKVMSQLDISERRIPQDGGFKMKISSTKSVNFRVSTCPIANGEKIVLRILDLGVIKPEIETLGFNLNQKTHFLNAIQRPQGMVLVTGPTGSGKTLSLYTALNLLNTKEVNISSIEDPIEMTIPGINQVNINPKVGLNFPLALRAFLRQDPDIIMVGEIRDTETAEIAVKAAQTGHLVLSTLHTNSAVETVNRLLHMGIPPWSIATSVSLIVAQQLARILCTYCKIKRDDNSSDIPLYKAVGCSQCTDGYKGRTGLFEVLPMTQTLAQLILSGKNTLEILKLAQLEGMSTLFQSGLEKVKQGITSIEEINRLTVE